MQLFKTFFNPGTMTKIENTDQLHAEIARLKIVAEIQEDQLKNDLKEIREDLKPGNLVWNALSSLTGIKMSKSEFFKDGIVYGLSIILQRFILKTEKKVEHKAYDFVDSIFERVKNMVNKFTSQDAKRDEREDERNN